MTVPYIWLGKNGEILSTGDLNQAVLGSDKWTVRPLLGWTQNLDAGGTVTDTFTPALLVWHDNPLLLQLLKLLDVGAIEDNDPTVKTAVGSDWLIFRLSRLSISLPVGTIVDLATFPGTPIPAFIPHADSFSFSLPPVPGVDSLGFPSLKLSSPPVIGISAPTAGDIIFTLTFPLKEFDLQSLKVKSSETGVFDLNGKVVTLSFDTTVDKFSINGTALDSITIPDSGSVLIPLSSSTDIRVIVDRVSGSSKLGFEFLVGAGEYIYEPLIANISSSSVKVNWEAFCIRIYEDRVGLAAPPKTISDKLMLATFNLPLIQAKVSPDAMNALTKIVSAEDSAETILAPLKFSVKLRRPKDTTFSIEPLLWLVTRDQLDPSGAGKLIRTTALDALRAVLNSTSEIKLPQLNSFFASLQDLTSFAESGLTVTLGSIKTVPGFASVIKQLDTLNTTDYQLPLALRIKEQYSKSELIFLVVIHLNLWEGRLRNNRAYFYIAASSKASGQPSLLDLDAFAIQIPVRNSLPSQLPDSENHDGYLDFEAFDVVLDALPVNQPNRPQLVVLFPGGLTQPATINADGNKEKEQREREQRRVRLSLEDFTPEIWPEPPQKPTLQLRLGSRGVTFAAKADTSTAARIPVPGVDDLAAAPALKLVESRDGLRSGLVVINSQVRYANLLGRIDVPGFDALEADIQLSLRRKSPNSPLEVIAAIDLERSDRQPLAQLKISALKGQLDDLRMRLTWVQESGNRDWKFEAWASGAISVINNLPSTGGIKGLEQPRAIPFRDLDLIRLNLKTGSLPLSGSQATDQSQMLPGQLQLSEDEARRRATPTDDLARFELLDGQFKVEFQHAILTWDLDNGNVKFEAERARFDFQASSGDLDIAIEAGKIQLQLKLAARSLEFRLPSSLGLEARIGTQIRFLGTIGWVDTPVEKYFFAAGRLLMTGFPEVAGTLKMGTGIKTDGSTAPNLAIFAALPYEAELFSGVVMKEVGLGLGVNNRLAALGPRPEPREILARLNQIDPKQPQNWSFVSEGGVYVSVVATAVLGSNRGNEICAYIAKLVLSIDTNIDIVAVAQIWLFSSLSFLNKGDNERRPALVGAAVLRTREQTFSLVAQTMPQPAIEANKMLSNLLNRARAKFSFYLSSDLADYYLEELSYSEDLFGISVLAMGSYRIAIGRFGALLRATLALRGTLPRRKLSLGVGGFTFSGNMMLDADFGGLVTSQGLTAYGTVRAGISLRVSAYILIPTLNFETRSFEKTFSITISIPYLSCKRWRCKWKTKEISETVKVRVKLIIPVLKREPYHLPETTLELVLAGALAFDESGGIGFSGTLAISTTIFGHPLRIAPRFDYRPGVVDSVRNRVAAVEDRINRLRSLPRPAASLPNDDGEGAVLGETWYYYTSRHGDKIYHLLVPSPEKPTWWYTPHAADLNQYANLPRDTSLPYEDGGASDLEQKHLSPFRSAVMRMVLPFTTGDNKDKKVQEVIDLLMPWDRGNYDAFPSLEDVSDEDLIALVMQLTEIESAFLNTAAKAEGADGGEVADWQSQEESYDFGSLNGVEVVSDPRPESGARVYWSLSDQITRPDSAIPYRYRPVEELVAEGFTGVDRRGDIGRLLRYETVRRRAIAQGRLQDHDLRPARKLAQNRASLLSTILADFVRETGPQTYAPIDAIELARDEEGRPNTSVIARRRTALWVFPETAGGSQYKIKITYAVLENNTDLDLTPSEGDSTVPLEFTWRFGEENSITQSIALNLPAGEADPSRYDSQLEIDLTQAMNADEEFKSLQVTVRRTSANSTDAPAAPSSAQLIFEPAKFRVLKRNQTLEPDQIKHQVGLFAVTNADQKLQLDLSQVRIIRNEENSTSGNSDVQWANERPVRIIPMTSEDPVAAIQRWVTCLPPCQEFIPVNELNNPAGNSRVRVRLPIKFEEELLKAQLPRLNGFEIYRRFPWEQQPVKIAEGVTPVVQRVDESGQTALLVESFLFTEEFPYNPVTQQFEGVATGVVPGVTQIEYLLRAIPYGRLPLSNELPTFRRWPAVTLYIPPLDQKLPALGLVIPVENLLLPDFSATTEEHVLPVQIVDSRHVTWDWPEQGWKKLEIWAEPQRIRSSGAYALEEEPTELTLGTQQTIKYPRDLTIEQLPESVIGKIKIAELTPGSTWQRSIKITQDGGLRPGLAYRLFIRPAVATETPLVQPVSIYLIRKMVERVDERTALCHTERLELISLAERDRILQPFIFNGKVAPRFEAWLGNTQVTISRRPNINSALERLRVAWNHLSDLDAGVEIFVQDVDESHRVDRRLVTVQEESVFQTAIRDFRNPTLWQPLPKVAGTSQLSVEPFLDKLRSITPHEEDEVLLLWQDERNPIIERIRAARENLLKDGEPTLLSEDAGSGWAQLHQAISEYQFALLTFQRTPLAPVTPEDREGLNALAAIARTIILGKRDADATPGQGTLTELTEFYSVITSDEAKLRAALNELADIDLSAMTVTDTPEDYERVKIKLQDIGLARKFAEIIELRLVIANALLDPDTSYEDWEATLSIDERLPGFEAWNKLLENYNALNRSIDHTSIQSISPGSPVTITTSIEHGLKNGDQVFVTDVQGIENINNRVFTVEVVSATEIKLNNFNFDSTTTSGGRIQRKFMEQTYKLLTFFKQREWDLASATGQQAAQKMVTLLGTIRDPSVKLGSDIGYQKEVAKLVPQAAGLTAALETLRRDAQAKGWTLVRRPHDQLGIKTGDDGKREAVYTPLSAYLPANLKDDGAANIPLSQEQIDILDDASLVMPFVNLLERFGFAIDLAAVDALNQPIPQARLLEWIAGQTWPVIRSSNNIIEHEIVLITGREPDTDRDLPDSLLDEDQSLGYAFIKIAVIPRSTLADLLEREIEVNVSVTEETITDPNSGLQTKTLTLTFGKDKGAFEKLWGRSGQVILTLPDSPPFEFAINELSSDGGTDQSKYVKLDFQGPTPVSGPARITSSVDRQWFRNWLQQRSMLTDEAGKTELTELKILQRMVRAWAAATTPLKGSIKASNRKITVNMTVEETSEAGIANRTLTLRFDKKTKDFEDLWTTSSQVFLRAANSETILFNLSELKDEDAGSKVIVSHFSSAATVSGPAEIVSPILSHVILETRSLRWATVPVLGGRAHIDWQAFDSAGHTVRIALRRVSRYEALLRWMGGAGVSNPSRATVPTLSRIHGLNSEYFQEVELKRRLRVGIEEPTALSLSVSPHPTHIQFIYALPTSGARAAISGLSARRSGYQGVLAQFSQQPLQTWVNNEDAHSKLLNSLVLAPQFIPLTVTTITDQITWELSGETAKFLNESSFNAMVVFSSDYKRVRLSSNFTPVIPDGDTVPSSGTLQFSPGEDFPDITTPPAQPLAALINPLSEEIAHLSLQGKIQRRSTKEPFRLILETASDRLEEESQAYIGQILLILNSNNEPVHARLIEAFDIRTQILTLADIDILAENEFTVRILLPARPLQGTAIPHIEASTPVLFRNERLISLPDLPYYRLVVQKSHERGIYRESQMR